MDRYFDWNILHKFHKEHNHEGWLGRKNAPAKGNYWAVYNANRMKQSQIPLKSMQFIQLSKTLKFSPEKVCGPGLPCTWLRRAKARKPSAYLSNAKHARVSVSRERRLMARKIRRGGCSTKQQDSPTGVLPPCFSWIFFRSFRIA